MPSVIVTATEEFIAARTAKGLPSANPELYAAFLDVFAARESGYQFDKAGDCPGMKGGDLRCTIALGARSYGGWQTPVGETPKFSTVSTAMLGVAQAKVALKHFQTSMEACPDHPLSMYMSGKCLPLGGPREIEMRAAMDTPFPAVLTVSSAP